MYFLFDFTHFYGDQKRQLQHKVKGKQNEHSFHGECPSQLHR